jgi:hypothetical protein
MIPALHRCCAPLRKNPADNAGAASKYLKSNLDSIARVAERKWRDD